MTLTNQELIQIASADNIECETIIAASKELLRRIAEPTPNLELLLETEAKIAERYEPRLKELQSLSYSHIERYGLLQQEKLRLQDLLAAKDEALVFADKTAADALKRIKGLETESLNRYGQYAMEVEAHAATYLRLAEFLKTPDEH